MTVRRRIAVLTSGRQDFGILRSTCHALTKAQGVELSLIVGGLHLSDRHGRTVRLVEAEGLPIAARIEPPDGGPPEQAAAMVVGVANALRKVRPSALMLVGDCSETLAAAIAAQLERVPIVHLHGGEETEGAIDNALRHALTKLSHLHLVSHADHARRILQMGEPDDSVHVVGAPGLDNLHRADLPDSAALASDLGVELRPPVVVVTYHPTTLGGSVTQEVSALVEAMERINATYVITRPNNDAGADEAEGLLETFVAARKGRATLQAALGEARYFGLMQLADAMIGNSSSALIEAPIMRLPVVNIGDRQKGRMRGANVVDVAPMADDIAAALRRALIPDFERRSRPSVHMATAIRLLGSSSCWRVGISRRRHGSVSSTGAAVERSTGRRRDWRRRACQRRHGCHPVPRGRVAPRRLH